MIEQKIGKYRSFVLEKGDMVVVMGEVARHGKILTQAGFSEHPKTGEWVGTGANLYAMRPGDFYDLFSGRNGPSELEAQATDGENFYQIDALPLVEEDADGRPVIAKLHALDLETRTLIASGVANLQVG